MKVIKSIIIVAIITMSFVYAGTSEILNPKTNVYDFTYNNVQQNSNTYNNGTIIAKVAYEIESTLALLPRTFKVESCPADSYGNRYCPEALSTASNIWTYDQSQVVEQKQYVTDYEQGNYKEFTSTVRDFMDGFASSHASSVTDYQTGSGTQNIGSVIDYQNGSSVSGIGQVVDYTNKVSNTTYSQSNIILQSSSITYTMAGVINNTPTTNWQNVGTNGVIVSSNGYDNPSVSFQGVAVRVNNGVLQSSSITYTMAGVINNTPTTNWQNVGTNGVIVSSNGYDNPSVSFQGVAVRVNNGVLQSSSITYTMAGVINNTPTTNWQNVGTNGVIVSSNGYDNPSVSFQGVAIRTLQTCSNGTTPVNGQCATTTLDCPNGYTATTGAETSKGQCKRTVSYNFYQYTCPSTYTPINYGFTSYTKTDPNTSAENWNTLDDAVNSATPPAGNCQKTITYSYYKYNCPTGYTVRDGGLTSACPRTDPNNTINNESTLSQPCNNSTPPTGNCEKIIPYTFYSYECSSGYTAIDKGLATCTKTDSSTSTDTSSSLDDPCNSATPPKENCYKDISYKHYTYGCSPGYITDNYGLSYFLL